MEFARGKYLVVFDRGRRAVNIYSNHNSLFPMFSAITGFDKAAGLSDKKET